MQHVRSLSAFDGHRTTLAAMPHCTLAAKTTLPTYVNTTQILNDLGRVGHELGVHFCALMTIKALLRVYPRHRSSNNNLVVYATHTQLSKLSICIEVPTLRRQLSTLVSLGFISRHDQHPYGRRTRKGPDGQSDRLFGFDLAPLMMRAADIHQLAEEKRRHADEIMQRRRRIAGLRRVIARGFRIAREENLAPPADGAIWENLQARLDTALKGYSRPLPLTELDSVADTLSAVNTELWSALAPYDHKPQWPRTR